MVADTGSDATCTGCSVHTKCQIFGGKILCLGCVNDMYEATADNPLEDMPQAGSACSLGLPVCQVASGGESWIHAFFHPKQVGHGDFRCQWL